MTSENDDRRQIFANGDFEKTVQNIISSPRRGKVFSDCPGEESLFKISESQREYYTKCFKHLLKITQGVLTDFDKGAVNGADTQVVEFFKKSGLDTDSLSRIWSLSDVNEDGWLDLNEFCMAMHLIVLRVKGEVPIPPILPQHVRPPRMPSRSSSQTLGELSPAVNGNATSSGSTKGSTLSSWDKFDVVDAAPVEAVQTPNSISLAQFSDVPPLLVDSRPTAIKFSAAVPLLSLKSPSGPPPQPPPRPAQKGHGRSASLDLKTVLPQQCIQFAGPCRRDSDSSAMTSQPLIAPPPAPRPLAKTSLSGSTPLAPPPVPQRVSPPTPSPPQRRTIETQTEREVVDKEILEQFMLSIGGKIDDLLGDEMSASSMNGIDRWEQRCLALRKQNAELDKERAFLAQIRIQLELRIQEYEEKLKSKSTTNKPTSL